MTSITFDDIIGLEDIEKKRGLVEFGVNDLETIKLQVEEIQPVLKKNNNEKIIVRDGRNKRKGGKTTELF